jgi:serine/threonine protein kinase
LDRPADALPSDSQDFILTRLAPRSPGSTVAENVGSVAATLLSATDDVIPMPSTADYVEGGLPRRFGGYDLICEVARGGMGVVYQAVHLALGRVVALKMILEGRLSSAVAIQRFHQEARAAALLDHPNIVPVFDIGIHEGRHYFTMPFIDGSSLKDAVTNGGVPAPGAAAALIRTVAEAVATAHAAGIVHRDLKPENILIDRDGRPRVTDFGLAKRPGADPSLTATGQVLGTPAYMAPEQANGESDKIGPTTDVYSLGGILYFALTGQAPFTGRLTEVLMQVGSEPPAPPRSIKPDVPEVLEVICLRCLEKEPEKRYPTARALMAALREAEDALRDNPTRPAAPDPNPAVREPELSPTRDTHRLAEQKAVASVADTLPMAAGPRRARWGAVWLIVGFGAVAAGSGFLVHHWMSRPKPDSAAEKSDLVTQEDVEEIRREVAKQLAKLEASTQRRDFGLEVRMVGGGQLHDHGTIPLVKGQRFHLAVRVARDAYVSVWSIEADGRIVKVFPNEKDKQDLFKAGEDHVVPKGFTIEAVPSVGEDRLWVIATAEPWTPPGGREQDDLLAFTKAREKLDWVERGMRLKEENSAVSEMRFRYRVAP